MRDEEDVEQSPPGSEEEDWEDGADEEDDAALEAALAKATSAEAIELLAGGPESAAGLPQGLRIRTTGRVVDSEQPLSSGVAAGSKSGVPGLDALNQPLPRTDVWILWGVFAVSAIVSLHLVYRQYAFPELWGFDKDIPPACQQCRPEWWRDFWQWRFAELARGAGQRAVPPPGMEWEWSNSGNSTDWFNASAELVSEVVAVHADPGAGPVLHIGCGDSPLPGLLHNAGFHGSTHLDISSQVVAKMQETYPEDEWRGMRFEVRDFLAASQDGGGPPPPAHRFGAVIDKAGIWDWLQDEADAFLPRLLAAVREALVEAPGKGKYIIATKQTPVELSDTLAAAGAGFAVEVTRPLGSSGIAFAYVLAPS